MSVVPVRPPAVWPPAPLRPPSARPRVRRTHAQAARDVLAIVVALVVGAALFGSALDVGTVPQWLHVLDVLSGVPFCFALWWRRQNPVALALVGVVLGAYSDMAGGALLVVLFTLAVHRRWQVVLPIAGLHLVSGAVYLWIRPDPSTPQGVSLAFITLLLVAVLAWGMFVRARRELLDSLRERAERAEAEQAARVAQARQSERTRIAREMHDVLAHRISLVSMHAGALEYRADASPAEVAAAAGVIRESAHQALEDLREVIGVLRSGPEEGTARPQPVLADLVTLLEEGRAAGARIEAQVDVEDLAAVPVVTGRNAYRILQEGLTNARKHAPGSLVRVQVTGTPGEALVVRLTNPAAVGAPTLVPGGGTGLVGLSERAVLAGGRLEHRTDPDGTFRLEARLPWPVAVGSQ